MQQNSPPMNDVVEEQECRQGKGKIDPGLHPNHPQIWVGQAPGTFPDEPSLIHNFGESEDEDGQEQPKVQGCEIHCVDRLGSQAGSQISE